MEWTTNSRIRKVMRVLRDPIVRKLQRWWGWRYIMLCSGRLGKHQLIDTSQRCTTKTDGIWPITYYGATISLSCKWLMTERNTGCMLSKRSFPKRMSVVQKVKRDCPFREIYHDLASCLMSPCPFWSNVIHVHIMWTHFIFVQPIKSAHLLMMEEGG